MWIPAESNLSSHSPTWSKHILVDPSYACFAQADVYARVSACSVVPDDDPRALLCVFDYKQENATIMRQHYENCGQNKIHINRIKEAQLVISMCGDTMLSVYLNWHQSHAQAFPPKCACKTTADTNLKDTAAPEAVTMVHIYMSEVDLMMSESPAWVTYYSWNSVTFEIWQIEIETEVIGVGKRNKDNLLIQTNWTRNAQGIGTGHTVDLLSVYLAVQKH